MSTPELVSISAFSVSAQPGVADALRDIVTFEDLSAGMLLVNVPQLAVDLIETPTARNRGYFSYPPVGLLYISAVLESLGVRSEIVDLNLEVLRAGCEGNSPDAHWRDALDRAIEVMGEPMIGISYMFDSTYPQLQAVCRHLRIRWPNLKIMLGGVAATADVEKVINGCDVDIVFVNEGERPMEELHAFLSGGRAEPPVNLSFRGPPGILSTTRVTGGAVDIDIRPQYRKIDIDSYNRYGSLNNFSRMRGINVPFATLISRRGCRAHCTFCSVRNFNGRSVRVRESAGVVDEMVHLRQIYGIRHFDWLDDDLLYKKDDALGLFHEIRRRLPDCTWAANNGLIAAAITPDLMSAMQESNCIGFTVGLETGNRDMLRKVRKPATIEKFLEFAALAKDYPKLFCVVNFILGLPGESFSQMKDSFRLALAARLSWNNFFTFQPLKNTDAWSAYGRMDDGIEEEILRRGTTVNFNPARTNAFQIIRADDSSATGYEIFDLSDDLSPDRDQRREIWFTFNYVANFLRNPALFTENQGALERSIAYLEALGTAYADNPSIDAILYYLRWRQGMLGPAEMELIRRMATEKFARSDYWRSRDQAFRFTAFLDRAIPPVERGIDDLIGTRQVRT